MAEVVIPQTVTVHLGRPDEDKPNVTVDFAEYIKNVTSSEIYPTWPEEAIRANVLAQISYTLNRIFTEHYRSRGYNFDITNTTQFDHAFVANRDIFENISRIVDDIFNNYIVREGRVEPIFAQFCDGVKTQCNGLSQWGSVDLAKRGLSYLDILKNYYGNDIKIVRNAPVGNNTPSYPGVSLGRGSFGEDVIILKRQLNRIAKNYPAIPKIDNTNGAFDAQTEASVREFQRIFNLKADGKVGKSTWYKIKSIYSGVKRLSELTSEGLTISEAQRRFPRVLKYGDSGPEVSTLQYFLAFLGYFYPELPPIAINGKFDENTRDAVFTFQNNYGLKIDGIVGRNTWNKLQQVYNSVVSDLPSDYQSVLGKPYPGKYIVPGDKGENVVTIQKNLQQIFKNNSSVKPISVTGEYDEQTRAAVRILQRQLGFDDNSGAIGPVLWSEIVTQGGGL